MAKSMYDLRATVTQIIKLLFKCYFELTLISNPFHWSSSKISIWVIFLNICLSPKVLKKEIIHTLKHAFLQFWRLNCFLAHCLIKTSLQAAHERF